jgi:site-specific DNA-cytosine methylase
LRTILDTLRRLDYHVQLLLLNTKDFGIPQNRERLFFICNLRDKPRPEISGVRERKTEITSDGLEIYGRDGEKKNSPIAATLTGGAHSGGNHSDMDILKIGTLRTHKDGEGFREMQSGVCPTIPARAREDGSGQPVVMFTEKRTDEAKLIRKENMKAGKDYSPRRGKQLMPREDNIGNCLTGSMTVEHILSDGISIRRLTPTECERLQGFPEIEKYGRIKVWLDHQNNYVNVGNKNHKLLKSVGNVEKIENRKNALFAGRNMSPKFQNNNKPVPLNVHIFCEENGVLIRNQQELLLNASGVEKKNWSHPFIKIDDFVQLLVGLNIMLEKITRHGEVALQQNEQFLIPQKNGNKPEKTFGSEIMLPVRDAENDSTTLRELLKSTTLDRLNTKVSEQNLKTLSLFVIRAIIGYIPKKIFSQHSFTIRIHTKVGYTYGLSDTQRYKTLGNAVTVEVVEEIAKTIKKIL